MDEKNEPVDFSVVMDLYVQKISLETAELTSSISREIRVIHSSNGKPEDCWMEVLKSAQKITEFINLFCRKGPQKISMLTLVVIDKLQGAYNKFVDAARMKNDGNSFRLYTIPAKLFQRSAKFFTYALIAEKSGQTLFHELYLQAGEALAQEVTHRHCFYPPDQMDTQLECSTSMVMRSETQKMMGNVRASKIYETLAQYRKVLAAVAVINYKHGVRSSRSLDFRSTGLEEICRIFDHQLEEIAHRVMQLALWQAEVMLWDLHQHIELLRPNIIIPDDNFIYRGDINSLINSVVGLNQDQEDFLNDWLHSIPAELVIQILRLGGQYLPYYAQLVQAKQFLQDCVQESQTNVNAHQSHTKPFYRRLWKHINQQAACLEALTSDALDNFLHTATQRSVIEWTLLHANNGVMDTWMQISATLDSVYDCITCYTQQLESVRHDRPTKVVEVITRAWQGAQSSMQQLLVAIEACVSRDDHFTDVVHSEDVQDMHNNSCLQALAYATVAQDLHLSTASFSSEARITQLLGDVVCTEALDSVMVQLAVYAEQRLDCHDKKLAVIYLELSHHDNISAAQEQLDKAVGFRNCAEANAAFKPRAVFWRNIYRAQVLLLAEKITDRTARLWPFQLTFNLLVKRSTNFGTIYDPPRKDKTMEYLLLSTDYYLRSFGTPSAQRLHFARLSKSYGLAAQAQDRLSSLTCDPYDPAEDVSITLVRIRVDRHLCVAQTYLEQDNDHVMLKGDKESMVKASMLHTVREIFSNQTTSLEMSDYNHQKAAMVWENLAAKEVFTRYLPQIARLCERLPNYDVVLSEQQLCQIDEFVACCVEQLSCETGVLYAELKDDVYCGKWWKRAKAALNLVCTHLYAHCFGSLPVEMIRESRCLYEAIKKCAAACDERRILHAACVRTAELGIEYLKRICTGTDLAAREQNVILCQYCVQFLSAALQEDTTLIELTLKAIECQKRVVLGNSITFVAKCQVAAADTHILSYIAGKSCNVEAELFYQAALSLFLEAESLYTSGASALYHGRYKEGKTALARAKALT